MYSCLASFLVFGKHTEHAVGHAKAPDDIDGGEDDGYDSKDLLEETTVWSYDSCGSGCECARDGDAAQGVHPRHEGGVQQARHIADELVADEGRHKEDGDEDQWVH